MFSHTPVVSQGRVLPRRGRGASAGDKVLMGSHEEGHRHYRGTQL